MYSDLRPYRLPLPQNLSKVSFSKILLRIPFEREYSWKNESNAWNDFHLKSRARNWRNHKNDLKSWKTCADISTGAPDPCQIRHKILSCTQISIHPFYIFPMPYIQDVSNPADWDDAQFRHILLNTTSELCIYVCLTCESCTRRFLVICSVIINNTDWQII